MSRVMWPSGVPDRMWETTLKEWDEAKIEHRKMLAAFLRRFADQVEREGLPEILNNSPGWGNVVLLTTKNSIEGIYYDPDVHFDEPVMDTTDGKIKVLVGPRGINNCQGVLVLPLPGQTVRVRAEQKL